MKRFVLMVCGLASMVLLCACQTTTVTTTWKSGTPIQPFKKVLAMVVNATPGERRAAEDEMVKQFRTAQGVAAYAIIPDGDVKDREKIHTILVDNGFDGAVVLRLVSTDKTTTYVPPRYDSPQFAFYGQSYAQTPMYRAGYTVTDVTIRAEVSVYSVTDGKLLWAGTSGTTNPENVRDLVAQVAKGTREELRKQGMLP